MRSTKRAKQSRIARHKVVIGLGIVVVVLYGAAGYKAFHAKPPRAAYAASASARVPVYYQRPEDAMPFPATLDSGSFKRADVRKAYQVAREIPAVLVQHALLLLLRAAGTSRTARLFPDGTCGNLQHLY